MWVVGCNAYQNFSDVLFKKCKHLTSDWFNLIQIKTLKILFQSNSRNLLFQFYSFDVQMILASESSIKYMYFCKIKEEKLLDLKS